MPNSREYFLNYGKIKLDMSIRKTHINIKQKYIPIENAYEVSAQEYLAALNNHTQTMNASMTWAAIMMIMKDNEETKN